MWSFQLVLVGKKPGFDQDHNSTLRRDRTPDKVQVYPVQKVIRQFPVDGYWGVGYMETYPELWRD